MYTAVPLGSAPGSPASVPSVRVARAVNEPLASPGGVSRITAPAASLGRITTPAALLSRIPAPDPSLPETPIISERENDLLSPEPALSSDSRDSVYEDVLTCVFSLSDSDSTLLHAENDIIKRLTCAHSDLGLAGDIVMNPLQEARKIFWSARSDLVVLDMSDAGFPASWRGHGARCTRQTYNAVVREKFFRICELAGESRDRSHNDVIVKAFPTVSPRGLEEYQVAFRIKKDGRAMRFMAEKFNYPVPYTESCFEKVLRRGIPTNDVGEKVHPYTQPGDTIEDDSCEPFRSVDCIRLFQRHLYRWCNFKELEKQNVLKTLLYPEPEQTEDAELASGLRQHWGSMTLALVPPPGPRIAKTCRRWLGLTPRRDPLQAIMGLFGEELAFMFMTFSHIIYSLMIPAAVSLFYIPEHRWDWQHFKIWSEVEYEETRWFWIILIVGANTMMAYRLRSLETRYSQSWGMKNLHPSSATAHAPDFDADKSDLASFFGKVVSIACLIFFCLFVLVTNVALARYYGSSHFGSLLITGATIVFNSVWPMIADRLTSLQNNRTNDEREYAYSQQLAVVQIFNTLLPFLIASFGSHLIQSQCKSLDEWDSDPISILLWGEQWVGEKGQGKHHRGSEMMFRPWTPNIEDYLYGNETACLSGCHPLSTDPNSDIWKACIAKPPTADCITECDAQLYRLVRFFYLSTILSDCFIFFASFLILRYRLGTWDWQRMREELRPGEYQSLLLGKKFFGSLAGSITEDYIELTLLWLPVATISVVEPLMCFFALPAALIKYRVLAWRMTNTCRRGYPRMAVDLGIWPDVFTSIALLSCITQVALLIWVVKPIRSHGASGRMIIFIIAEHVFLAFVHILGPLMSGVPRDVQNIEEIDSHFQRKIRSAEFQKSRANMQVGYKPIDFKGTLDPRLMASAPDEYEAAADHEASESDESSKCC